MMLIPDNKKEANVDNPSLLEYYVFGDGGRSGKDLNRD